ncbi:MAG: SDR family NAD(P)-dependent oxidoreductase [Dehalococcoidia bacterium]
MKLRDRTAIVTGASSGIGRETARLFARRGANVLLASRSAERLAEVVQELQADGERTLALPTDVTDRQAVEAMVGRAAEEFGSVDILVNNAGLGLYARLAEGSMENIRHVFEVNVLGALNCIQAVVPYMKKQRRGLIINVSSLAGKIAAPGEGAYSASKFALTAISDALRLELFDYGIKVISVYPGPIQTLFRDNAIKEVEPPSASGIVRRIPAVRVAEAIVRAVRDERAEVYVTRFNRLAVMLKGISPRFVDWGLRRFYGGGWRERG